MARVMPLGAGALGPLLADGSVAAWRQARLGAFLVSAYGGLARLAAVHGAVGAGGGLALGEAAAQAGGIVAAVLRGTSWQPDFWVAMNVARWEFAWLPNGLPRDGVPPGLALALDAAALGLAIASVVRPAPLLPPQADAAAPFAGALALAELEGGRLQLPFLRLVEELPGVPAPARDAAIERRRAGVAALWDEVVAKLADR